MNYLMKKKSHKSPNSFRQQFINNQPTYCQLCPMISKATSSHPDRVTRCVWRGHHVICHFVVTPLRPLSPCGPVLDIVLFINPPPLVSLSDEQSLVWSTTDACRWQDARDPPTHSLKPAVYESVTAIWTNQSWWWWVSYGPYTEQPMISILTYNEKVNIE